MLRLNHVSSSTFYHVLPKFTSHVNHKGLNQGTKQRHDTVCKEQEACGKLLPRLRHLHYCPHIKVTYLVISISFYLIYIYQ